MKREPRIKVQPNAMARLTRPGEVVVLSIHHSDGDGELHVGAIYAGSLAWSVCSDTEARLVGEIQLGERPPIRSCSYGADAGDNACSLSRR